MTRQPATGNPGAGGAWADDETRITLGAIARWKQTAADEVDNIGGWRDADPGDRLHKFWSDPARQKDTEHGSTMPNSFYGDTAYLLGWVASNHEKLDPTPLQDIYDAVGAWHDDHNAERVPEQRVLMRKLDRAMQVVQAVEGHLVRASRESGADAPSEWEADQRRLRYLVTEMKLGITEADSWGRISGVTPLQDEAERLALKLGFPGAPLRLAHRRSGEPGFEDGLPRDEPDAVMVLGYSQHGPLGQFSMGVIGCLRPGEIHGKPGLIEVDFTFNLWKPDAIKSLNAWERAIDGMASPRKPAPETPLPPQVSDWEATLRRAHDLVRATPERFREAGTWLDTEYSEEAVRERRRRDDLREPTGHVSANRIPGVEPGRDTRLWRLHCVGTDWRAEPPNLSLRSLDDPVVWSYRILLYICLVTDRDVGEYAGDLTELASLPWEKGVEGDLGRGWCDPDDIWDGKEPWRDLVQRAVGLVAADSDPASTGAPSGPAAASAELDRTAANTPAGAETTSKRRKPKTPTRAVSLTEAAGWFGFKDYRTLKKCIETGSKMAQQLSNQKWIFDLDQVLTKHRRKADPSKEKPRPRRKPSRD